MTAEYRLTIRVRNNLLLRRIEATRGFVSLPKFCAKHGFNYTSVADLIGMRGKGPINKKGQWYDLVEHLASILRADPADLFPERQIRGEILTTTVSREVGEDALLALSEPTAMALIAAEPTPERLAQDKDLAEKLLADLPPREREAVSAYFGLNGVPRKSMEEIGDDFGIGRARCDQLFKKAQTRMRSALYRKHQLMSSERYHELEDDRDGWAWTGRDWG